MLPQINNKSLMECSIEDLEVLLHNPDYRENQYLDYKEDFAFLKAPREKAGAKITEFRNDVCSFANSDGGYILYGISDDQGTADELLGVEILNPDKFELDLRNKLTPIMPKIPPVESRFVPTENDRYLVIVHVEHDYYAPYIHVEVEKNYKIYKRDGNHKTVVSYAELKNMFIQSRVLEEEIMQFRKGRIEYYKNFGEKKYERYILFNIIPEYYLNDRKQLFLLERQSKISFAAVFSGTKIDSFSLPCVDGLRFINTYGDEEALLYNNGIAEFILPLTIYVGQTNDGSFFYNEDIWRYIDSITQGYQGVMPEIFGNQRYFGCISIIGCQGVITEKNDLTSNHTKIDRNEIICSPVAFNSIEDKDAFYLDLKKLHLEYLLSVGIKRSNTVSELIDEIKES